MSVDAVMPAQPEGQMGIRAAVDPELLRIGENSLVTIGGIEKQRDRLAGPDRASSPATNVRI